MKIFVTGGTGFIGSYFIKQALENGHQIVALKRLGSNPVIHLPKQPIWVSAALDDVPTANLKGCDALVHFAAQGVSPQPTNWNDAFEVNVRQSLALFEQAAIAGVPHLISCGTCFEYGKSAEIYDLIPPDAKLQPSGPYASSKAAFSFALEAFSQSCASNLEIVRPFHLYGEGQHSSNFWASLQIAALSGANYAMTPGEQLRDYMPVQEAALSFLNAVESPDFSAKLKISNLGTGHGITLREFALQWWLKWGAPGQLQIGAIPYRDKEVMRFIPNISESFRILTTIHCEAKS